jgi:uncharacterized protein (TIGR03066 family)
MNALKLAAVVAVVCLIGTGAGADEKDYSKLIVGKWELTKVPEGRLPKGTIIDFTKDGKVMVAAKKDDMAINVEGTYKVDGDKLMVTLKVGENEQKQTISILKLTDSEMHVKNEQGDESELTKKK